MPRRRRHHDLLDAGLRPNTDAGLPEDLRARDALLGVETSGAGPEPVAFRGANAGILERLIASGYVAGDARRHGGPSAREVLDFLREHPTLRAHGRVEGPGVAVPHVVLEGLESEPACGATTIDDAVREAFGWFAGDADEYVNEVDWLYARWGP